MSLFEIFLLAFALSIDAFAVAICAGLKCSTANGLKSAIIVGLYFGAAQAIMPIIGFFLAAWFAEPIFAFGHIVAFVLLGIIGGKMIWESLTKGETCDIVEISPRPSKMLPFAIATSIDALAVGISFAFLEVNIIAAALIIGIMTFSLSIIGVKLGALCGTKFKAKAEFAGGVILILMGVNILLN
ncbi:MAG: manganese efflux pump MntP family protein [Defluviitaleaceae bacterium]|nr:manganese efflux pump MntP family protein [Defluviitaleaceae bacterium]